MSKSKLEELAAAEAETIQEIDVDQVDPVEPVSETVGVSDAGLTVVIGAGVGVIGKIICNRANVPGLQNDEINSITEFTVTLLQLYDLQTNPKVAAWIGLGGAVAAAAVPRIMIIQERQAAAQKETEKTVVNSPGMEQPEGPEKPAAVPKTAIKKK